jgi:nitrate reductase gamma subunit
MIDAFLFVGLPYIALVVCVVGCIWRSRHERFSMSARSSQFLEDRALLFGSTPWHIGILIVLLGHLVAGIAPRIWSSIVSVPAARFAVETVGVASSLLAIVGLSVLIVRRVTNARIQAVTTSMDLAVVTLLLAQVVVGLLSSLQYRYGSAWSTGTVVPYFWSLVTLQPDARYVAGFPMLFKLHLIGAWLIVLLVPFTRLMHVLAVPLQYIGRAPQLVLWSSMRRKSEAVTASLRAESRRDFLRGAIGVGGASGLLAIGVSEKAVKYFSGPRHDVEADSALLEKKLVRLRQTAEERELELERQRSDMILVGSYATLEEKKGRYFIDYAMAPGLAFKGADGLPILISAKCTHLGCTVGSEMDAQGRILCPCHVSYFSVLTGEPNVGAPAKAPLPMIGWAIIDATGRIVASKRPGGSVEGASDPAQFTGCNLYITRPAHAA